MQFLIHLIQTDTPWYHILVPPAASANGSFRVPVYEKTHRVKANFAPLALQFLEITISVKGSVRGSFAAATSQYPSFMRVQKFPASAHFNSKQRLALEFSASAALVLFFLFFCYLRISLIELYRSQRSNVK